MTTKALVSIGLAFVVSCGSSDPPPSTPVVDAATSDAVPIDAQADTPTPMDAGGCMTTGGLPPAAAGKATVSATFSEATGGYNGTLDPFEGPEGFGSTDPDAARFITHTKVASVTDGSLRKMLIAVGPMAKACQSFVTTNMAAASYPYFEYYEGPMLRKQFVCGGIVVVDTVVDKAYTFHFDVTCLAKPVLDGAGSVRITGKGAGTRP